MKHYEIADEVLGLPKDTYTAKRRLGMHIIGQSKGNVFHSMELTNISKGFKNVIYSVNTRSWSFDVPDSCIKKLNELKASIESLNSKNIPLTN